MKPYFSGFKYNIKVLEQPNSGETWLIYENFLEKGIKDPIKIDHIEIHEGCNYHTSEKKYDGLGFAFIVEGKVTYELNELSGARYVFLVPINN